MQMNMARLRGWLDEQRTEQARIMDEIESAASIDGDQELENRVTFELLDSIILTIDKLEEEHPGE